MAGPLHRFERGGTRFAMDPDTVFCFQCDDISWDVLESYPGAHANRIAHELGSKHDSRVVHEVIGELEWLRISKSILQPVDFQASLKALDEFSHLVCVEADLDGASAVAPELLDGAARLLALRSGPKGGLTLRVRWPASNTPPNAQLLDAITRSANNAAWAGKKVDIEFRVIGVNLRQPSITIDLCLPIPSATFEYPAELNRDGFADLRTVVRIVDKFPGARLVWRPRANNVAETMKTICDAGLLRLEIDVEGAYLHAGPDGTPAMADALSEAARWYAEYLAKGGRARVEPFAELFRRVHAGDPRPRMDETGVRSLFIQPDGSVYPSEHFVEPTYRVGNVITGEWNEDASLPFGDLGYPITAGCARCWARNVCGGGYAAIHRARTGAMRGPDPTWCDAHRAFLESAIAAFHAIAGAGLDYGRLHAHLGSAEGPGLLTRARVVLGPGIGLRPLREADAALLTRWESWRRAAYFLLNERNVLTGHQYAREMDALHPLPHEHEFVIVRRDGDPAGLLRLRPGCSGTIDFYLYLHAENDYADKRMRKGLEGMLAQAFGEQHRRRVLLYSAPWEQPLRGLAESAGFRPSGPLRDALFTRGRYHDVLVHELAR